MKFRNIMVAVVVGTSAFTYGNPGEQFLAPLVEKVSGFFRELCLPKSTLSLGSTFTTQELVSLKDKAPVEFGVLKETLKKESPSLVSNMSHKTVEGRVYVPSQNPFGMDINLDEDRGSTGFETFKIWVKERFSSKPLAAAEQEKKPWMDQIKENPGTTAAIAAGSVVALYGSYKLIQYFDQKKAKKIALAKRLKSAKARHSVVYE
jgi:hypothetical protein